jgi:hypothetical protein
MVLRLVEALTRLFFDILQLGKPRGGTPLPLCPGRKWQRKQNNIRAARFAGCPAAVLLKKKGAEV